MADKPYKLEDSLSIFNAYKLALNVALNRLAKITACYGYLKAVLFIVKVGNETWSSW